MAAILPGTRLGRYEVDEYLGAGTLGPIHRAYDPTLGTSATTPSAAGAQSAH